MKRRALILIGVLFLLVLCILCILVHAKTIEEKLKMRVQETLRKSELNEILVSFDGRNAYLYGNANSADAIERAVELTNETPGVRLVRSEINLKTLSTEKLGTKEISDSVKSSELAKEKNSALELSKLISDLRVEFDFDSYQVNNQAMLIVNQLQSLLKKYTAHKIEIQGHSDSKGTHIYNEKLSIRRAEEIRALLVNSGIPVERLIISGLGESSPIGNNSTFEGRKKNRRVEFIVKMEE